MTCNNCKSDVARAVRAVCTSEGIYYSCDLCGGIRPASVLDVYLGSSGGIQTDPNLVDPKTGTEIPFSTKGEKKAIMDRLGLRQSPLAERHHGQRREEFKKKTYFT